MARRTPPKNPRRGPGHNAQNRTTKGSKATKRLLDGRQEMRFKYFMDQIMVEEGGMEPEVARPITQMIWAKGARINVKDSLEYLDEKKTEGQLTDTVHQKIRDLIRQNTVSR